MADLITNEQEVKKPSLYLKLEDGSKFILLSNLVMIRTHFVKEGQIKRSVICRGDGCFFCEKGLKVKQEYFYWANVDGVEGIVRLPAPIFYDINESERLLKKSKREFAWIVSKKGSGLSTRYSVTRGEDIEVDEEKIKENNAKLLDKIKSYENSLVEAYDDLVGESLTA